MNERTKDFGRAVVLLLVLLVLDRLPALTGQSPVLRQIDFMVSKMHNGELSADDLHALAAGYYEGIEKHEGPQRIAPGAENTDYVLRNSFLRYEFKPNLKRRFAAGMRITNSLGMPNPEYSDEKPLHTRRIAWLGDSISVGPYGRDYEALLEARLNHDCLTAEVHKYEILNFSVPGYILVQKMDVALEKAPKFHPDVYVVQLSSQEIQGTRSHIAKLVASGSDLKYDFLRRVAAQAGIQPSDSRSIASRKLAPFFLPVTRWALEQIRNQVASEGARMIVVLVPVPIDPHVTAADFDALHPAVDSIGVPVIDLRDTFRSANLPSLQVVPGSDIHPNTRGHEMLFEDLYSKLRAQPDAWSALTGSAPVGVTRSQ